MDGWQRLLDGEREDLRFLLSEEFREDTSMQFVRINDELVINLATVTHVEKGEYDGRLCIKVWFITESPLRIYQREPGYRELMTWMDEQAPLLNDD